MPDTAYNAIISAPGFSLGVQCNDDEITRIDFLEPQAGQPANTSLAGEAVRQLQAYLLNPSFEFGLPLRPSGTAFQRRVWSRIAAIPSGETNSYGQLAKTLNNAPRAVGQACGANPFPVVVPCHRVVRSEFKKQKTIQLVGNYSGPGGVAQKQRLLSNEGVLF